MLLCNTTVQYVSVCIKISKSVIAIVNDFDRSEKFLKIADAGLSDNSTIGTLVPGCYTASHDQSSSAATSICVNIMCANPL